uniref:THAP-type domain-containing protein n=1 Tax=Panagrolaimus sp. ES5 TaxID=591445 RepID=A0AC34FUK8_9BILA
MARYNYCASLGVPEEFYHRLQNRRYICLKHFDEHMFTMRYGKRVLKVDALPKKLSETEKHFLFTTNFNVTSYRNLNNTSSPQQRPLLKVISPTLPSSSTVSPALPSDSITSIVATVSSREKFPIPTSTVSSPEIPTPTSTVYPDYSSFEFDIPDGLDDYEEERIEKVTSEQPEEQKDNPKYVMVQHDKLMELCRRCYKCGHIPKSANPSTSFHGTACKIKLFCKNCNDYIEWESQELIPGRNMYKGNLEMAAAVATAPLPVAAFLQFATILSLAMFDKSTYYKYMPTVWAVVGNEHDKMQTKVLNHLQEKKEPIHIAADGQYDTRGFSAFMCCVTLMDTVSRLIMTNICLDKNIEKCPSTNLERLGLEKAIRELLNKGLIIASLTTDRSKSVIAMMQSKFSNITHMYDPWHLIKGVAAILRKECKNARAKNFKDWCQALLNQLWYSVTSANGNGKMCQQFAVSSLLHSIGIHEWEAGKMSQVLHDGQAQALNIDPEEAFYNEPLDLPGKLIHESEFESCLQCGHGIPFVETATKAILCPLSKSYGILQKTFTNDNFLNDLLHLSPKLATSSLEGFHGLVSNIYRTKNHYFDLKGFTNRTKLAVLHYNNNVFDELNGNRKVIGTNELKAKHRGGDIVTKKRKTPPVFTWKKKIIAEVLSAYENQLDVLLKEGMFGGDYEEVEEMEEIEVRVEDRIDELFESDVEDNEY